MGLGFGILNCMGVLRGFVRVGGLGRILGFH